MTADTTLRGRIETAARTVPIRLGPNALAMAQRGEPVILNYGEAAALADALLPLFAAERENGTSDEHLRRLADAAAISRLNELVDTAAALLEQGTDPATVAAQLREHSERARERHDRRAAARLRARADATGEQA